MNQDVLIYYDDTMLGHNPVGWDPGHPEWAQAVKALLAEQYPDKDLDKFSHPERPERLTTIIERLQTTAIPGTRRMAPEPAEPPELLRVHTADYVGFIESLIGGSCWLAQDTTAVSPGSVTAAKLAAGAGVSAVEAFARGDATKAFCVIRPPGHHALADKAMGFCLYNNAAVTAAHARAALGWSRVLIWDWDLHHGNGTQDIFYNEPGVVLVDSHCAAPFYPGSGAIDDIGAGAGCGYNLNVPLPPGSGNAALLAVADRIVRPAAAAFKPDLVIISAGFDCHYLDQTFAADDSGFAALTRKMRAIADDYAGGRLLALLEGGYNAQSLADSAHAVISVLAGNDPPAINVLADDPGCPAVAEAAAFHAESIARMAG